MRAGRASLGWVVGASVAVAVVLTSCGERSVASGGPATSQQLTAIGIAGIGDVLVTGTGRTLYHVTTEQDGSIQCTDDCAVTWPPLAAAGGAVPAASQGIAGRLGVVERPDGSTQVTFEGMPLYTYSGDTASGQANGQGVGGVWFAVTTTGSSSGGPSGSPGATPTETPDYGPPGGRYGG